MKEVSQSIAGMVILVLKLICLKRGTGLCKRSRNTSVRARRRRCGVCVHLVLSETLKFSAARLHVPDIIEKKIIKKYQRILSCIWNLNVRRETPLCTRAGVTENGREEEEFYKVK